MLSSSRLDQLHHSQLCLRTDGVAVAPLSYRIDHADRPLGVALLVVLAIFLFRRVSSWWTAEARRRAGEEDALGRQASAAAGGDRRAGAVGGGVGPGVPPGVRGGAHGRPALPVRRVRQRPAHVRLPRRLVRRRGHRAPVHGGRPARLEPAAAAPDGVRAGGGEGGGRR